jgi:hypothetical protein
MSEEDAQRRSWVGIVVGGLVKLAAFAIMLAIPLLGVWSASSLAAYSNGPIWLAIACGALAFPVLPLAWDLWRERVRARREKESKRPPSPRILTFVDRMILRTIVLDGAFLALLFGLWPQAIFTALSTRGDWFLDGVEGAEGARGAVLSIADGMEWLYEAAHDNPYATDEDREADDDDVVAGTVTTDSDAGTTGSAQAVTDADAGTGGEADAGTGAGGGADAGTGTGTGTGGGADAGTGTGTGAGAGASAMPPPSIPYWPMEEVVHPAISSLTPSDERSIASVASHIRAHTTTTLERAKAVHDYVATRVRYDVPALTGHRPPQDAETVFETRNGVCEGYARLFHALADEVGLESRYLVGDARDAGDPADGEPHAWNAIEIDGAWFLVDPTWDAGTVDGTTFTPRYSTLYFLTPPDVFVADHFPDNRGWQLRPFPISRGEFHRAPILSPRFRAQGFELRAPDRSQVEVAQAFEATVVRPSGMFLLASYAPHGGVEDPSARARCDLTTQREVSGASEVQVRCDIPGPGTWEVMLFSNTEEYGHFGFVGSFQAVRR